MENYHLIGAGGHAAVVIDMIENQGGEIMTIFDIDISKKSLFGIPIKYWDRQLVKIGEKVLITIGNNRIRQKLTNELVHSEFGLVISEAAKCSRRANISFGTVVMSGSVINALSCIGHHCIINTNSTIEHECVIGDYVHVSPNATLCGNVSIGEGTHIGANAVVVPGVQIGKWVTVGAGAVIIKDVPDFATIVGNPGRIINKPQIKDQ